MCRYLENRVHPLSSNGSSSSYIRSLYFTRAIIYVCVTVDLRILQITESEADVKYRDIICAPTSTEVWFENSEFVRKVWRATSWNFNRGWKSRAAICEISCVRDEHGLEVDGEKQLIRPHITARIPGQTFRARDASHSSTRVRVRNSRVYVNCTQRASLPVLITAHKMRDLIKLIIRRKKWRERFTWSERYPDCVTPSGASRAGASTARFKHDTCNGDARAYSHQNANTTAPRSVSN